MKILQILNNELLEGFTRPSMHSAFDEFDEVLAQQKAIESGEITVPEWVRDDISYISNRNLFRDAISSGKRITVSPDESKRIMNYTYDVEGLDADKLARVSKMAQPKKLITMPIVIKGPGGALWLLAGNTRLSYNASVLGEPTDLWQITVS